MSNEQQKARLSMSDMEEESFKSASNIIASGGNPEGTFKLISELNRIGLRFKRAEEEQEEINMSNELPSVDYSALTSKWGGRRVEDVCIFIGEAKDHRGILVNIPATTERVEAILEAVYGEYENVEPDHRVVGL